MNDYRKLQVWQRSHRLTLDLYRLTDNFPKREMYGLTSQIRGSASSIPINLAEAGGRRTPPDRRRFIRFAIGSSTELEYQLFLAQSLGYMSSDSQVALERELGEIRGMLLGLEKALAQGS